MSKIKTLISITLIVIFIPNQVVTQAREHQPCGSHLLGPYGTIQTPNFPNPFPVPIKCRWIIENTKVNGTISIYFTQQYTTSGLSFTEYLYYDDSYKAGESKALTVTDDNITRVKWLQVTSPFLVVELSLSRLEGTQLRALGLLSVFGFNITYAVRGPKDSPGPSSCSAIECRLLGHCYANHNFQQFSCACFAEYSGADCGVGPLCHNSSNICHNGGTCRQIGPAAVSCLCAPGFTGDLCHTQIAPPECGLEECAEGCKKKNYCDCNPKDNDFTSARFDARLQIIDQTNSNISFELINQVTRYLKLSNITLEDDVEFLNISDRDAGNIRIVWLRIWGARRQAASVRAAVASLSSINMQRIRFLPHSAHVDMQPALTLQELRVNQRSEVWEGSEFIFSCMAYGSPDIVFTWYKDGVKINFNGTNRDIWTRTVAEDALGRRMAVLGVSEARKLDAGRWVCAAEDAGRRRCRAIRVNVLRPPDIRLIPTTLTVNKGENISITCLASASGSVHGTLGFSWAREKTLLPLTPGREVWEDLYPAGSVLKLYNIQRSGEFRCQVSSAAGTNAKSVMLWTLAPDDSFCEASAANGLQWPRTAPGAHASAPCPPGHTGLTLRFCEPKVGQHGVKWHVPDFSECVADSLDDIYNEFVSISYGFSWKKVSDVAHEYSGILRSLPAHPGSGSIPLRHASSMARYLISPAGNPNDRTRSVESLMKIFNTLLKSPDSFLDEENVFDLQKSLSDVAGMSYNFDLHFHEFTVISKPVRSDNAVHFKFHNHGSDEWLLSSAGVEVYDRTGNVSIVAIHYHNLSSRLPSLRRSMENKNSHELEYLLSSQQVQLSTNEAGMSKKIQYTVTLLFTHFKNYSIVASTLACAGRTSANPGAWSTKGCELKVSEPAHVVCRCHGLATYALFTVARSTVTNSEDLHDVVRMTVGAGGAMCAGAATMQFIVAVCGRKHRGVGLGAAVRAAAAGAQAGAAMALLGCAGGACEGAGWRSWLCALCWLAGGAALCAQPLLLHAELAGRRRRLPAVALPVGVCTLAALSARLWGGPPLTPGAAAAAVCVAAQVLLAVLCVALAAAAALRLGAQARKLPSDRRRHFTIRRRVARHSMILVLSTGAAQGAGVWYATESERTRTHVLVLSAAALTNGLAMLICYVLRDDDCLRQIRKALTLKPSHNDWEDTPGGDTSLSLYIKQSGEVESSGGAGAVDSSPSPSDTSYWRAPPLETPAPIHRRLSTPDTRADIVRCVEYKEDRIYNERHTLATRAVCDLIPQTVPAEYNARVCLELGYKTIPPRHPDLTPIPCSINCRPCLETAKQNCILCKSNPDISKITSAPIKSCLKKTRTKDFTSSISLPSMGVIREDKLKSDIEQVNRQWNQAYDSKDTERVLNKISSDLNFLLNRTEKASVVDSLDQIEEAPT